MASRPSPTPTEPAGPASVLVYTVHSDARALAAVSYLSNNGKTERTRSTSGDWTKRITPNRIQVPVVSAMGDGSGTFVSCSIVRDGVVMDHNRADGAHARVSCMPSGLIGYPPQGTKSGVRG